MAKDSPGLAGRGSQADEEPQPAALKPQVTIALTEEGQRSQLQLTTVSKRRIEELRAKARSRKHANKPS